MSFYPKKHLNKYFYNLSKTLHRILYLKLKCQKGNFRQHKRVRNFLQLSNFLNNCKLISKTSNISEDKISFSNLIVCVLKKSIKTMKMMTEKNLKTEENLKIKSFPILHLKKSIKLHSKKPKLSSKPLKKEELNQMLSFKL